jgi:hypothetical protein
MERFFGTEPHHLAVTNETGAHPSFAFPKQSLLLPRLGLRTLQALRSLQHLMFRPLYGTSFWIPLLLLLEGGPLCTKLMERDSSYVSPSRLDVHDVPVITR